MSPSPPEAETAEPMAMTWSVGRVVAVLLMLAMVAFWAWIFSGGPKKTNPDYLDDRAFADRTHQACQDLRDDLAELPNAAWTESPDERADVLVDANLVVEDFIAAVEADAPTTGDDVVRVGGWLTDWRIYLEDRQNYVEALRTEENPRFMVSVSELGDSVDKTIEIFADVNNIPDCATPGDVG